MDSSQVLVPLNDVQFQDVYYYVNERKKFVKTIPQRCILKGVSGVFRNGQLSAIIGSSGSGKSSLLNAISGFRTSGVSGHIRINRSNSCYITQEDHHKSLLTVNELMHFACSLKVKSKQTHKNVINEILTNLNLNHCVNVYTEKLSGGEKKRLSIALELIANPTIFFLDEPCSGLDEVSAVQCIRLLKILAKQGRTIVCTIHQPSTTVFREFDQCYCLAKGQCVFQGQPTAIIPFLSNINLPCPRNYSPPDYVIEICESDDVNIIPSLSNIIDNGKLTYCTNMQIDFESLNNLNNSILQNDSYQYKNAITTMFLESQNSSTSFNCDGSVAILERMKAFSRRLKRKDNTQISSLKQFFVLFELMMLKIIRNRIALWIQLFHHVLCGLMFGLIFLNSANKGERMFDHLKYCLGCIIVIVYTQVMVPILSYPSDVKVIKKDFFNRWYSLTPYYLALTLSRIPFQMIFNMIFMCFAYWMAGLPAEISRFLLFLLVGFIISFVAEGMGLAIGATFSVTNGSILGPLIIAPFMGLAIYGFDFAGDISLMMYALMKFSYIRVGAITMVLTVFGMNRPTLECNEPYCHFGDPRVVLRFLRIDEVSIWNELGFLVIFLLFFRILLFVSLKTRCKT